MDSDGCPFTLFPKIEVRKGTLSHNLSKEPMKIYENHFSGVYSVKLHFQRHYEEPEVDFDFNPEEIEEGRSLLLTMDYNPFAKTWGQIQRSLH